MYGCAELLGVLMLWASWGLLSADANPGTLSPTKRMQQHNLAEITKRVYESATPMDKYINKKRYIVKSEQIKRMDHLEVRAGNVTEKRQMGGSGRGLPHNCGANQFACNSGRCISRQWVCDMIPHCDDASDEVNCDCTLDEFECANGNCILIINLCNSANDCGDMSDEIGCFKCPPGQFTCSNGNCIDESHKCDHSNDCFDWSDELHCAACAFQQYQCPVTDNCIPAEWLCDGKIDCQGGGIHNDESGCICDREKFACANERCVRFDRVSSASLIGHVWANFLTCQS